MNPGPDSLGTSLSPLCHPAVCSSHTPTAVNCWSKAGQPKHSSVFGFCHLFWCFPLSLYPPWGTDLPRTWLHGHIQNGLHPALLYSLCPWPQSTLQSIGKRQKRNAYILKSAGCQKKNHSDKLLMCPPPPPPAKPLEQKQHHRENLMHN